MRVSVSLSNRAGRLGERASGAWLGTQSEPSWRGGAATGAAAQNPRLSLETSAGSGLTQAEQGE